MKTFDHIALEDKDRRAIAATVRLLQQRFPVERVILYGSKARGTDDEESDIDLLVLTSRELGWRERGAVTDALFDIEMDHGVVISALVISERQWSTGRYAVARKR
ncbi:MAG: nucleotidyltransferase domain-containing protein [Gammaproteobacteria bacterium]